MAKPIYETRPALPGDTTTVDVELIGGAVKWQGKRHEAGSMLTLPRDLADHLVAIGEARVRNAG